MCPFVLLRLIQFLIQFLMDYYLSYASDDENCDLVRSNLSYLYPFISLTFHIANLSYR